MSKVEACQSMIEGIKSAQYMEHKVHTTTKVNGLEKVEISVIQEEIPEGIKDLAIQYLFELANNGSEHYTIYQSYLGTVDYLYYLEYSENRSNKISLTRKMGCDMYFYDYFWTPSEILYAVAEIEKEREKEQLNGVEIKGQ